jgi:single-strand DNA-binding protein
VRLFSTTSRPAQRAASGRPPARHRHTVTVEQALDLPPSRPRPARPRTARPGTLNQHPQADGSGQPHHHRRQPGPGPEVRFTQNGTAVTNLRVAVTQRVQQDGQWRDGETRFFKVNVWRGQAENLAESLSKGDRVMVTGRLRQRSWETPEGDKRSVTEVEAEEVGASLKWATAKVERTSQRGNGERAQGRERQAEPGNDFNDAPPTWMPRAATSMEPLQ